MTALLVGYVSEPLVGAGIAELLDPSMSYAARLSLSVTAVLVFSTVVQMVFGELAPKNLAIARTVPLARSLSRSTLFYLKVAGPVVRLFDRSSTTLLRRVGIEPVEEPRAGCDGRGPHPDHRRVARGRTARRRPVGGARGRPALPRGSTPVTS